MSELNPIMKNSGIAIAAITSANRATIFRIPGITVSICFSFFSVVIILVLGGDKLQVWGLF